MGALGNFISKVFGNVSSSSGGAFGSEGVAANPEGTFKSNQMDHSYYIFPGSLSNSGSSSGSSSGSGSGLGLFDWVGDLADSTNTLFGSIAGLVKRFADTGWDDWTGNTANRENIAFQKEYNDTVFQRADTQYQRTVADLRASGLSAQLAAGSPSTVAGNTAAPQRSVGNESVAMERLVGLINAIKSTNASTKLAEAQAANAGADAALKKKELETYDQRVGVDLALKMAESRYTDALTDLKMLEGANYTAKVQADIKKAFSEVNKNDKLIELYDEQIKLVSAQEGKTQSERKEINQRIENLKQQEKNLKKEFDNIVLQGTKLKFESKVAEQQAATAAWNLIKSQAWNLRTTDTQSKFTIFGSGVNNTESLIDSVIPEHTVPQEYLDLVDSWYK